MADPLERLAAALADRYRLERELGMPAEFLFYIMPSQTGATP